MDILNYLLIVLVVYIFYKRVVKSLIKSRVISRLRVEGNKINSESQYLEFCRKQHSYFVYLSPKLRSQLSKDKFALFTKKDLRYCDVYLLIDDLKVMKYNDLIGLVTLFRRVYFKTSFSKDVFLVVGYLSRDNIISMVKDKDLLNVVKSNFDSNYCFVDKDNQVCELSVDNVVVDFRLIDDVSFLSNIKLNSLRLKNLSSCLDVGVRVKVLVVDGLRDLDDVRLILKGVERLVVTAPEFDVLDFKKLDEVTSFEFYKTKIRSFENIDCVSRDVKFILNGAFLSHDSLKEVVNYFDRGYLSNVFSSKTTNFKIDDQVEVSGVRYLICGLHIVDGRYVYDYGCRRADYGDAKVYLFNHSDVSASFRRVFGEVRFNESEYDDFVDYYSLKKRKFKRDVNFKVVDPSVKLSLKFFDDIVDESTRSILNFYNMSFYENVSSFCYNGISSVSDQFSNFIKIERAFINKVLQAGLVDSEILIALERFYLQVSHYSFTKVRMLFFFTMIKRSFWIDGRFSMMLRDCDVSVVDKCRFVLSSYDFYNGVYSQDGYDLVVSGVNVSVRVDGGVLLDESGIEISRTDVGMILF